ncbi:hypothetical protein GCM10009665_26020 [Kitasatospora nipponensis]|uniref:Uncharacterized protein n=1 Tax=Kitasatospora nipponensis TaxID=258049 RepID=A0ABN1W7D4_9ACTN
MRRPGIHPLHPRGRVPTEPARAIALRTVAIGDIAVLEHQRATIGPVAPAVRRSARSPPPSVGEGLDGVASCGSGGSPSPRCRAWGMCPTPRAFR